MSNQTWNYYVLYEYDEDGYYEYFDTIFEALAEYYQTINDGPTSAGSDRLIEIEFGKIIFTGENEEPEPLEDYTFNTDENTNN